ncbi:MAG: hypothetical protein M1546_22735 [Chloroflexi bacterium]|nr:hypothetical protein [Chloroflexota bacterium]
MSLITLQEPQSKMRVAIERLLVSAARTNKDTGSLPKAYPPVSSGYEFTGDQVRLIIPTERLGLGTTCWQYARVETTGPASTGFNVKFEVQQTSNSDSDCLDYLEPVQLRAIPDDVMNRLEESVNAGDESAFIRIYQGVQWHDQPANNYVSAIQLAVKVGAYAVAREIAQHGAERYPNHAELRRYAHVLAPGKIIQETPTKAETNINLKANRAWIRDNGSRYRGQYVALKNGQLLASAPSMRVLVEQLGESREPNILLTRVF